MSSCTIFSVRRLDVLLPQLQLRITPLRRPNRVAFPVLITALRTPSATAIGRAKMTRLGGAACAHIVGLNHETTNLDDGDPLNESMMDLRNNAAGEEAGKCGPGKPCRNRCREKRQKCELTGLDGRKLCWPPR